MSTPVPKAQELLGWTPMILSSRRSRMTVDTGFAALKRTARFHIVTVQYT